MRAGLLRDLVQFQQELNVDNDYGGRTVTWQDIFQLRGDLRQERGREALEAGRLEPSNLALLTVRYDRMLSSQIVPGWRAVVRGENWQILNVLRIRGRGDRLELIVERGTAQ